MHIFVWKLTGDHCLAIIFFSTTEASPSACSSVDNEMPSESKVTLPEAEVRGDIEEENTNGETNNK